MLRISKELSLPDDFITQVCAILARRGAGKTYTANVICEELLKQNLQVCVIDPLGVWHGLRSSADGKKEGFPVVVFGGEHGDLPLDPAAGELIADVVIERGISAVIDLNVMRKGEQERFVTDFIERVYHKNRKPLHLMVDEADSFCPQRPMPQQARMVGAMEDVVRRGRSKGLGMTMITQRTAVINKNILSQAEVLIALQTSSPHDLQAVRDWVETHLSADRCDTMMSSLPALPRGRAWLCSPQSGLFNMVDIRLRETFDSSSTPKVGETRIVPKRLAAVDIEVLKGQLSSLVEQKKADDPKELKAIIAGLRKELAKKLTVAPVVKEPVVPDKAALELMDQCDLQLKTLRQIVVKTEDYFVALRKRINSREPVVFGGRTSLESVKPYVSPPDIGARLKRVEATEGLSKCAQAVLGVLRRYPQGKDRRAIAVLSGYRQSGSFAGALSALQTQGFIASRSQLLFITPAGEEAVQHLPELPQGAELVQYWLANLDKCGSTVLRHLVEIYPQDISRAALAEATSYELSGSFAGALSYLRTSDLIESNRGQLKASAHLFV